MPLRDQAALSAQRFMALHHAEHLAVDQHRLIDRCAAHLVETFSIPPKSARMLATAAEPPPATVVE